MGSSASRSEPVALSADLPSGLVSGRDLSQPAAKGLRFFSLRVLGLYVVSLPRGVKVWSSRLAGLCCSRIVQDLAFTCLVLRALEGETTEVCLKRNVQLSENIASKSSDNRPQTPHIFPARNPFLP